MKFEIFKGTDGQYYWRARGNNGEKLCHSEGYTQKASALSTIHVIGREASTANVTDLTQS